MVGNRVETQKKGAKRSDREPKTDRSGIYQRQKTKLVRWRWRKAILWLTVFARKLQLAGKQSQLPAILEGQRRGVDEGEERGSTD